MFTSILSTQMELVVLAFALLLLYSLRHLVGTAPTYIATGLYFIFALLIGTSRLVPTPDAANTLTLDNGILWLPFVLLLLVVYELEGTGAAQRVYLGLFISTLFFFLLFLLVFLQPPGSIQNAMSEFFQAGQNLIVNRDSRSELLHGISSHLFLFLLVPILYQAVLNQNVRKFYGVAIFTSMVLYTVLTEAMSAIYISVTAGYKSFLPTGPAGWTLRLGSELMLAILGHFFIVIHSPYHARKRRTMKFLTSFVDLFLSPERMMRSLSEWSERYRVVIENSSEIILLVTTDNRIMNANRIAAKYIGNILNDADFRLDSVLFDAGNKPWEWQAAIQEGDETLGGTGAVSRKRAYLCQGLFLKVPRRPPVDLDLNLSKVQLDGQPIAVIVARDVTAQREEERQRQSQQEQMIHSQRLASLGELAGGIAHDFNNLLQSIQMSVDGLQLKCADAPEIAHLVQNIDEGCQRATALTSQLLGFARKGKFHAENLDASELLERALKLFQPVAKGIACRIICEPVPLPLCVDEIQMAQVLLNLLINARDALKDSPAPRKITLRAENATAEMPEWDFRPDRNVLARDYICIHVRDNGAGMTEEVRKKIFEPFFTTKPAGHGTGMGLPMAFGCIANHHGWLHVESHPGEGCDITIFLPRAK